MQDLTGLADGASASALLLSAMVVASLIALFAAPPMIERGVFRPYWLLPRREYPTLVSSAFLHADTMHFPEYGTLGASGAILAVLFASIVYTPSQSIYILPIPVPIPAPLFALAYLAYSVYASRQQRGHINHDAHLGGAVAGVLFVALTDPAAIARGLRQVFH